MTPRFAPTRVDWLQNGMRILTREVHHAPLAAVMVWYGVGSRNERPGKTGISHFLEHMMFKGTPKFPSGVLEEAVQQRGGMWNAFTAYDYTAYYEVLPARHLEFGLAVEADRMANVTFDPDLTVLERGIIVSEREGRENSPFSWLMEAFMNTAYREFPYRHPIIGYKDDVRATTADVLTEHYNRFYRPNNATLVVVGDFETERLLELAHRHFGPLGRGADVEPVALVEPPQEGERRVEVRRPGPTPHFMAGYKIPGAAHADQPALDLLSAVMSGPAGFGMRGGNGGMGRSSRFYRNLVQAGIAASASGSPWSFQYPGLFVLSATPVPGVSPERLEEAVYQQVEELRSKRISDEELARAKKQVRSSFMYAMEGASNQAYLLGATALVDSPEAFDSAVEEYEAVTAADLRRVAEQYLDSRIRTVGCFIPEAEAARPVISAPGPTPDQTGSTPAFQKPGAAAPPVVAAGRPPQILEQGRLVRRELPGGMTLLSYPVDAIPSVFVRVQVEAGPVHDPAGKAGLAAFAAQMSVRGTERYTADELALQTDALGISLRADVGRETAVYTLKSLPEDLETGLGLLAEILLRPTFPETEIERLRDRTLVSIRQQNNDTRAVTAKRLAQVLYPDGHPYGSSASGDEESVRGLGRTDLVEFHRRFVRPAGAVVTAVGSIDPAGLEAGLVHILQGWQGGQGRPAGYPTVSPAAVQEHLVVAGKTQTDIAMGWPLVERSHPDYLALEVLAILFGGNGYPMTDRLFRDVREKHGLSYYQYASFSASLGQAPWSVHIGVSPARLDFAIDLLKQELGRLSTTAPTEEELANVRRFLEDYPAVQNESPERVAARLAEMERFDLGLDYLDRYAALVRGLSGEHLREVAARHLDLRRMVVVTAGPERDEPASEPDK